VLAAIVGERHLLTSPSATRRYRTGYRYGGGSALAVARPATLVEFWRVLQACAAAQVAIIVQAANTGLTGGSTPDGEDYGRPVVIVSTLRIKGVRPIRGGRQALCLAGATLYELERALKPLGREPHSVIGSSCFGASVVGGVCNNSGGALVRRGPAFTDYALYARLTEAGELELVDRLGLAWQGPPEALLARLDRGDLTDADIVDEPGRRACDHHYADHVRHVDEPTPARFNADPRNLSEASGSAGKLAVFAVRLDTFPAETDSRTFYVGTRDPAVLTQLRRRILKDFKALPIAGEYIHRGAFDMAWTYGKDIFLAVRWLGTDRLPLLFAAKAAVDEAARRVGLGAGLSDRLLQAASRLFPEHLPQRMLAFCDRFEHHLLLKVSAADADEAQEALATLCDGEASDVFECTPDEAAKAFLHRFAVAGAAIRYRTVHAREVEEVVALDVALPRNAEDWVETLPGDVADGVRQALYYGHFLCHVFHQDYVLAKGCDPLAFEHRMWRLLDERGAEYPAEHNVGHLYKAKPALADFYRQLDPGNGFNPGIGQTSKRPFWR
jgi:D-lactate dehydrogenase